MGKYLDTPSELKEFVKLFEQLMYRHQLSSVFEDYMDYFIEVFRPQKRPELIARLKSTYEDKYEVLIHMFHEHLRVMKKMVVSEQDWYDLPGTVYEALRSNKKASALGQFFTPESVSDLVSRITLNGSAEGKWGIMNDCASGSGRMLLAGHVLALGNYWVAQDVDPICAKMCAVNFLVHGVVGEVACMNTLLMGDYRFGYVINPLLNQHGVPTIEDMTFEEHLSGKFYDFQLLINKPVNKQPDPETKMTNSIEEIMSVLQILTGKENEETEGVGEIPEEKIQSQAPENPASLKKPAAKSNIQYDLFTDQE